MWAIGGASGPVTTYYSDVYSSGNGSNWSVVNSSAPFGGRYGSQVLSFGGQLWLIGGNKSGTLMNDVWSSVDGKIWTQILAPTTLGSATQFSPREDFGAVVFNNAMWVIGGFSNGQNNDDWTSTTGTTWTRVLANGAGGVNQFQARWGFSSVVYNNAIWVMGGAEGNSSGAVSFGFGDLWTSPNGTVWTLVNVNSPYGPSHYHQTVVNAANLLAVTGGFMDPGYGSEYEYDTTSNGTVWNNALAPYPPRFGHLSLEFNNNVWVIGGCDDYCDTVPCHPVSYLNDVWYAP